MNISWQDNTTGSLRLTLERIAASSPVISFPTALRIELDCERVAAKCWIDSVGPLF